MTAVSTIRTLQLVTTQRPFFEQQVAALERNGVDCTVLTVPRPDEGGRSVWEYVEFELETLGHTLSRDFDLVHANYGLTAPSALTQPQRPVVLSLWGSDVFGRYGLVSKACARLSDAVIVMSEDMATTVGGSCHVLPHGIDLDRFEPEPTADARSALGWDPNARHVLFPYDPARPVKNYDRAQRVVDRVRDRIDVPVELKAVHGVAHEQIPTYMNAADAVLLTSDHEGSPNSIKEAMACNLPVVSVDVGDVDQLIADVSHSHVCQSDAELVDRLTDVLDTAPRSDGRDHVQPYSLERMGERLRGIYERQLNGAQ